MTVGAFGIRDHGGGGGEPALPSDVAKDAEFQYMVTELMSGDVASSSGLLEDLALRSGMALLTVRKVAGLGGSILHAICLLAFGLGARQCPPYSQDLPLLPLHGP